MTITLKDLTNAGGLVRRELPASMVRAEDTNTDARTVTGIGVPYGVETDLGWFRETFEPGACDDDATALAFFRHSDPIGLVAASKDTTAGREVTLKLSKTPTADEALTLARDGVIRSLSIGFEPVEWREEHDDEHDEPLIVHTKVRVREYSLVPFPAYDAAEITRVRQRPDLKETPMDPIKLPEDLIRSNDLDEFGNNLRAELTDTVRKAMLSGAGDKPANKLEAASEFRSMGAFVHALVGSDVPAERKQLAQALYRDVTTTDVGELKQGPGWIGDLTKKLQARRRWISRFTSKPLPSKGMTVDYVRRTRTATVGEQKKQLDPLPKGTTRGVTSASAPVRTFGGAETVSRQVIDRLPEDEVAAIFEAMAYAYAEETDQAMQTHIISELDSILSTGGDKVLTMPASPGAFDWISTVVDAAEHYDGTAYGFTELAVSSDIFKSLATEAGTDGRPLLSLHSGTGSTNVVGTLNLPKIEGNLLNVPVRLLGGTTARALFLDPVAFEFRESPGAPFRLTDDEPLNLSRDLAVYGYGAFLTPHPDALLPIQFGTATPPAGE